MFIYSKYRFFTFYLVFLFFSFSSVQAEDALASWKNGDNKQAIIHFITETTTKNSKSFIEVENRIAVFDNDGTLWSEHPFYFQLYFVADQIGQSKTFTDDEKAQALRASLLKGEFPHDISQEDLLAVVAKVHADLSPEQFREKVQAWIATAKHPMTGKKYTEMVFQPMLELIDYLKRNDYKVFIVSGGGVEFLRAWAPEIYGVPTEQIIGSQIAAEYRQIDGHAQIVRLPKFTVLNDKEIKPVSIYEVIGKRPVMAFGNSDGDLAMLEWTAAGEGPRFAGLVHHTDQGREWAYDRGAKIGALDKALDRAKEKNWFIFDMKKDWTVIFDFENK